jgi:glc operon protein GlcG
MTAAQDAFAQEASTTMDVKSLTAAGAELALAAAETEARSKSLTVSIAVVDVAGNLLAFRRMDRAMPATVAAAIQKAQTAAQLGQPSKVLQDLVDGGKPSMLAIEGLRPLQGGMPLIVEGVVVGGIGVSGAAPDQDEGIARSGTEAI